MLFINNEERQILMFLRTCPDRFFTAMEISKRAATRKLYEENPRWVLPHLRSLSDKKLVEWDAAGHYRYLKDA